MNTFAHNTRPGEFNFAHPDTESTLLRNGKVYMERDRDGSDTKRVGLTLQPVTVDVADARSLTGDSKMTCETNGFELLDAPLDNGDMDFLSHSEVAKTYYRQCELLVEQSTGARAYAFDHNVRSALGKKNRRQLKGGQQVQGPAKVVHGDYTLFGAPQRLRELAQPPNLNDTLRTLIPDGESLLPKTLVDKVFNDQNRFAIINVWRSIAEEPVQTNPLAVCDSQTIEPTDLVTFEIRYHDRIGENYFAKHNSNQRFYFYPELTRSEPLLLKQWDSAGTLAQTSGLESDAIHPESPSTFAFHSAFVDPSVPDTAPDRLSIEVRCVVLY